MKKTRVIDDLPLFVLIVATIALEWLRPIRSSFWLDEAGTVWVIKGGVGQAFHRVFLIQGQTPAYYLLGWVVRHLGGDSEALLRSISFVASAATAFVVYRIARRWFDSEGGAIAALIFVASANTAFAAADARPYALASLLSLAGLLSVMKWTETDRIRFGLLAGALTAAAIYVHYLFALIVPMEILYMWLRHRNGWRPPLKAVVISIGFGAVLLVPTVPQLFDLIRRRGTLSFAAGPTFADLLRVIGLPLLLLLAGVVLGRINPEGVAEASGSAQPAVDRRLADTDVVVFGVVWTLFAPLTLLLLAWTTSAELFVPRYFLTSVGGTAVLSAWGIARFRTRLLRTGVVGALVLASILANSSATHTNEDWRGAARAVRVDSAREIHHGIVLMWTGLVETRQPSLLEDPARYGFLIAPGVAYDFAHPVYALPFSESTRFQEYLDQLLGYIDASTTVYVVSNREGEPFVTWFSQRLGRSSASSLGRFGRVAVVVLRGSSSS